MSSCHFWQIECVCTPRTLSCWPKYRHTCAYLDDRVCIHTYPSPSLQYTYTQKHVCVLCRKTVEQFQREIPDMKRFGFSQNIAYSLHENSCTHLHLWMRAGVLGACQRGRPRSPCTLVAVSYIWVGLAVFIWWSPSKLVPTECAELARYGYTLVTARACARDLPCANKVSKLQTRVDFMGKLDVREDLHIYSWPQM
jgi:hypothetical protein